MEEPSSTVKLPGSLRRADKARVMALGPRRIPVRQHTEMLEEQHRRAGLDYDEDALVVEDEEEEAAEEMESDGSDDDGEETEEED